MQKPHFSAIVVGGSGAVGSWLVRYLMRSGAWESRAFFLPDRAKHRAL